MVKGEVARVSATDSDFFFAPEENQKRGIPVGAHSFVIDVELVSFTNVAHLSFPASLSFSFPSH